MSDERRRVNAARWVFALHLALTCLACTAIMLPSNAVLAQEQAASGGGERVRIGSGNAGAAKSGYVVIDEQGSVQYRESSAGNSARAARLAREHAGATPVLPPKGNGIAALAQYVAPTLMAPTLTAPTLEDPAAPPCPPYYDSATGVYDPRCAVALPPPLTRHYVNLDALGWWMKGDQLPALVTTSPVGTPQLTAGVLGEPTTSVLIGNQTVNGGIRPGGRVQGGIWVDPYQTWAIEGHYYALATETTTLTASSTFSGGATTDPILARPFFDNAPGIEQQAAVIVAFPDYALNLLVLDIDGSVQVKETSRVQSAGGGVRYALNPPANPARFFLLGAYRFFQLNESLSIVATSTPGRDPFPFPVPPESLQSTDNFSTKNTFNGGEIGLGTELGFRRWTLGAETRLAMGNMHQTVTINGSTAATSGVLVASYPGGLLTQPSNIGTFDRDQFSLIPQVDVKLGFQIVPSLRLTVGYNFTYVTQVLRPGDQIDLNVNTTQIAGQPLVGPASPSVPFDSTSIWLQGITGGLDLRF